MLDWAGSPHYKVRASDRVRLPARRWP